jgi:hypothetical protein
MDPEQERRQQSRKDDFRSRDQGAGGGQAADERRSGAPRPCGCRTTATGGGGARVFEISGELA